MKFSERIIAMQQSPIRKLVPYADKAKERGKKVYHLNIGQPDIETPKEFLEAIHDFDKKVISYAHSQGIKELIDSLVEYYKKHDIYFENDEILITNGGSEALIFSLIATCDHEDEVLVPEPFYTNYNGFSNMTGVNVVPITTKAENGFHLPEKSEITKLITDKTKAILLSNPGNPTGTVYTKEEIYMLKDIALEYDLFIIADEVYKEFVFDGQEFMSFAHLDEIQDRVILTDSISKRYSACGARIGSIASKNKDLMKEVLKLAQGRLCVATIEQVGAANLINTPDSYIEEVKAEYWKRRDIVYNALQKIDGVVCEKPHGAFYLIAKLPIDNAEDFVVWLLEEFEFNNETVMMAPAEGFYATEGLGKDEVRISYCINADDLEKAMNILNEALKVYPGRI
jgi:aspartate aminotransferase